MFNQLWSIYVCGMVVTVKLDPDNKSVKLYQCLQLGLNSEVSNKKVIAFNRQDQICQLVWLTDEMLGIFVFSRSHGSYIAELYWQILCTVWESNLESNLHCSQNQLLQLNSREIAYLQLSCENLFYILFVAFHLIC